MRPKVAILLATHNGSKYLPDLLKSLENQIDVDWCLYVSDDQSVDDTWHILEHFRALHPGRVYLSHGPCRGAGQNFLTLLKNLPEPHSYVAFCDQDDVWLPRKLIQAVRQLKSIQHPAMYFSGQIICDEDLKPIGHRPSLNTPPSFGNALVQSIAPGNTIVLNAAAVQVINGNLRTTLPHHDWWAYQVISGTGGTIVYDPSAHILYRQHQTNLIGARIGAKAVLKRASRILCRQHALTIQLHTQALLHVRGLTETAQHQLQVWNAISNAPRHTRSSLLRAAEIRMQTPLEQKLFNIALHSGLLNQPSTVRGMPHAIYTEVSKDS